MKYWKDIPNYEGYYQASNFGEIRSVGRTISNRFSTRVLKHRTLKCSKDTDGYRIASLSKNSKVKKHRVGVLIAETFLNYKKTKESTIDHINNVRDDDMLINIQVVPKRYNSSKTILNKSNLPIGVSKTGNRFQARKSINGVRKYLGLFKTVEEAKQAYDDYYWTVS